jgi:hypothetical protein
MYPMLTSVMSPAAFSAAAFFSLLRFIKRIRVVTQIMM